MRRTVLAVVVVLTLAGCGASTPTSAAAVKSTVAASSEAASAAISSTLPSTRPDNSTVEKVFGEMLQKQGFVPRFGTVRSGIDMAREVCSRFDAGDSYSTVAAILTKDGMTASEAGSFTGMATVAFCPRYASKINH